MQNISNALKYRDIKKLKCLTLGKGQVYNIIHTHHFKYFILDATKLMNQTIVLKELTVKLGKLNISKNIINLSTHCYFYYFLEYLL